ncbi:DUF2877 domain-containing protein [Aerococcus agrisoli]|uniref:DUF2877 domain-containing protein n=1 Tax=Aerococcus agrisoli TaxID=2487350 RepID=A0A3N4GNE1_9LACT|nr:DUF2877 domain-containing protein [Aerococcus agrisoli]RPA63675.1 DUF2877 domain-containing protein [Aerococcus agrisoli]
MGELQATPIMLTVSSLVYPLNKFGRMGHIHSKFDGSFIVQVKNQLMHFGCYQRYIAGFGAYMSPEDFETISPCIEIGNRVRITDADITFYGKKSSQTFAYKASKVDQRLHALPYSQHLLNSFMNAYQDAAEGISVGLNTDEAQFQAIQHMLEQVDNQAIDWDKVIHYLIGRGRGLTPSGDDMLVGYLAIMKLFAVFRAEDLSDQLQESPLSTTDISRAYLLTGAEDYFSNPICRIYAICKDANQMTEDDLTEALSKGISDIMQGWHTSGQDITFGLGMGLRFVQHAHAKVSK